MIDAIDAAGKARIVSFALDAAGRHVALLGTTRRLRLVPIAGGRERTVAIPEPVGLALSDDGASLVVLGYDETSLYSVPSLEKRWTSKQGSEAAAFSPDGTLLALGSKTKSAWIVEVADGRTRPIPTEDGMLSSVVRLPNEALAFDRNGQVLYGTRQREVQAANISVAEPYEARLRALLSGANRVLVRSPTSPILVAGGDTYPEGVDPTIGAHPEVEHLTVLDTATLAVVRQLPLDPSRIAPDAYGKTGTVQRACFVPGTDTLVALHERTDGARMVHAFTATTGARIFSEVVDRETRDLAADGLGHLWLLTHTRAALWRKL